jgi:hypothetical protein
MKRSIETLGALALALALGAPAVVAGADATAAAGKIGEASYLGHVKRLASDEFEGRAPATKGETLTVNYLVENFRKLGLAPGNPDGTYVQKVPLVSYRVDPSARLEVAGAAGSVSMKFADDYVAWTRRLVDRVDMKGELVFVGYGVVAPEFGWDDFKDVDVRGKVVVMLINDPPIPDPADPSKLDEKTFGGKAMTYYGRWTYKYEIAAAKGAAGCIIVHETKPASYGWEVVRNGRTGEQFTTGGADKNMSLCPVEGWITFEKAQEVFKLAGKDFVAAKQAALGRDFRPMPLGLGASLTARNTFRSVESQNVVAKLEGSDPKLKKQFVIYTAHWDHFGVGDAVNGDSIYNGAVDNATGTAGLLELAKAFAATKPRPKRSVLFLLVTAEERGLLGSAYYGEHPLYPLGHCRRDQHRRDERARAHAGRHGRGARKLDAGRRRARSRGPAGARREARPAPGSRELLPLRPLQLRKTRRPGTLRELGRRLRRQARRFRRKGARAVRRSGLPQAVGRGPRRLGRRRSDRRPAARLRSRLARRERVDDSCMA